MDAYWREQDMINTRFGIIPAEIRNVQRTKTTDKVFTPEDYFQRHVKTGEGKKKKKTAADLRAEMEALSLEMSGGNIRGGK